MTFVEVVETIEVIEGSVSSLAVPEGLDTKKSGSGPTSRTSSEPLTAVRDQTLIFDPDVRDLLRVGMAKIVDESQSTPPPATVLPDSPSVESDPGGVERVILRSDFVLVYDNESRVDPEKRLPSELRDVVGAFGHITMGCTGTHVGDGIVLTAGHCILPLRSDTQLQAAACPDDFDIRWNYLYKRPAANPIPVSSKKWKESECVLVEYAEWSAIRDIAFVRFDSPPDVKARYNLDGPVPVGTLITLLSFPQAKPLTWTPRCEVADVGNATWLRLDPVSGFTHQCDTEEGSSGAAVIRRDTWEIIGVHDGGKITGKVNDLDYGWNYGTFLSDPHIRQLLQQVFTSR